MIISRTPLRMSFVGGGTDLPAFCEEHGGAVVSTAIDKWIRVIVSQRFEGDVRVGYSEVEIVGDVTQIRHELVREAMRRTGIPRGVDVLTLADVPSRGTGLGSSSAVTVGLLNALYAFQGIAKPPSTLAEEASEIEIDALGKPIGRQDQYAAAVGGFNLIEFLPRGEGVRVSPLITPPGTLERLHSHLLLFYTGLARGSDHILRAQGEAASSGVRVSTMLRMRELAYELRDRLSAGDVGSFGELLQRGWELKLRLHRAPAATRFSRRLRALVTPERSAASSWERAAADSSSCSPRRPRTLECVRVSTASARSPSDSPPTEPKYYCWSRREGPHQQLPRPARGGAGDDLACARR